MRSYNAKIAGDTSELKSLLEMQRFAFNFCSKEQFKLDKLSLVILHSKVYKKLRKVKGEIPAQIVIKAEQECLAAYRSARSNKHKKTLIEKTRLSVRLDKRLYSVKNKLSIGITGSNGRKQYGFELYPRLQEMLEKFDYADPLLYEKNGEIWISFPFETAAPKLKQRLTLGVDVGIRRSAALSDGRILVDRKFEKEKRRLRFLKRNLKSKATRSARRHLRKLSRKEHYKNKNQTHHIANEILRTDADTIVLENLKSIKVKKHKYENKRRISQVPLFELRRIVTYKAEEQGKTVLLVCPAYTSQRDCVTGRVDGERQGCRYYSKSGLVYDADINAAINIAKMSNLPVSQTSGLTYGQALVTAPIVHKSFEREPHRPPNLFGGK